MISHFNHVPLCVIIWTVAQQALCPWDSPSKNTGMGCHDLPQEILPTQGWKPNLLNFLHLQAGLATHSSTLAWKIPWTEEPGRLQSMGSRRVGHD